MHNNIKTLPSVRIEKELKQERNKLALAFHRGKSLSELKELLGKIHCLETKLATFLN